MTNQPELRDRIAEALMRWAESNNNPQYASMRRSETVRANAYSRADAVLAALPAPADQATVLREAAARFDQHVEQILDGVGDKAVFVAKALRDQAAVWSEAAETLRRMAADTGHDDSETEGEAPCCSDPTCACIQVNAAGRCECARWDAGQPTAAQQPEVVHGCPPDGSGLTPCCGRTPFELPLTDRISSEAPITCPGAAAPQPKEA